MSTRGLLLWAAIFVMISLAAQIASTPSYAIGKATPTPSATEIPEDYDVDQALEDLLSLLEEGRYDDGLTLANWILQEDAEAWRAYYYRGFAHVQLDDLEAGIEDYTRVLELRPWDSHFWRLRGELHLQERNPRGALGDYKRSLFHNPNSTQTYSSLAKLRQRDIDKRLHELYQAIVKARQDDAQGASSRALNLLTEAIDSFDRGSIPAELGYAYYARANIRRGQELLDKALADLSEALALQPDMHGYYLARGSLYAETERPELAGLDFYQRMILLERESIDMPLDAGGRVTVEMGYGLVARLRFEGAAGQRATVAARDYLGAGVDPLLALLDVSGEPVIGDDNDGGERDALISDYELPANGTYTAVVSHANGGYEGMIRVSLRIVSGAPTD